MVACLHCHATLVIKSYSRPEEPGIRAVERPDVLKINGPIESVVPGVALRIKFNFCADDINAATESNLMVPCQI